MAYYHTYVYNIVCFLFKWFSHVQLNWRRLESIYECMYTYIRKNATEEADRICPKVRTVPFTNQNENLKQIKPHKFIRDIQERYS